MAKLEDVMIGDILFLYDDSKVSSPNALAQRALFRDGLPIVTHVALFCGNYTLLHSMPSGVEETLVFELIAPGRECRILRLMPVHDLLKKDEHLGQFWCDLTHVVCDSYNWRFNRRAQKDKYFCSELIARFFETMGHGIAGPAHKVLPTHWDRIARANPEQWMEMTDEYSDHLCRLNVYRAFNSSVHGEAASRGLAEAKNLFARHRLIFQSWVPEFTKVEAVKKHFGTVARDEFFDSNLLWLNNTYIEELQNGMPEDVGRWFRAFVHIFRSDEITNRFVSSVAEQLIESVKSEVQMDINEPS